MGFYDENGIWQEDEDAQRLPITGLSGLGQNIQMGSYRGNQVASARDPGMPDRLQALSGLQDQLLQAQRERAMGYETRGLNALNTANSLATAGGIQKNALPDAKPYLDQFARTQTSLDAADTRQSALAETQEQRISKYIGEAYEDEANKEEQDYTRDWNKKQFDYRAGQDSIDNRRQDAQLALQQTASNRQRYDRVEGVLTADGRPVFYDRDSGGTPRVVDSRGNQVTDLRKLTSGSASQTNYQSVKGANGQLMTFDPRTGTYKDSGINVGASGSGSGGKNSQGQSPEDQANRAQDALNALAGLKNHPGMGAAVGSGWDIANWGGMAMDKVSAGTNADDFRSRAAQAAGILKLAQSGSLKGTLTDKDMQLLGESVGDLQNYNISEKEYRHKIEVAESIVRRGLARAQQQGRSANTSNLSRNQDGTYNWRP